MHAKFLLQISSFGVLMMSVLLSFNVAAKQSETENEAIRNSILQYFAAAYLGDSQKLFEITLPAKERFAIEPLALLESRRQTMVDCQCAAQEFRQAWLDHFRVEPPRIEPPVIAAFVSAKDFQDCVLQLSTAKITVDGNIATVTIAPSLEKEHPNSLLADGATFQLEFRDGGKVSVEELISDSKLKKGGTDADVLINQLSFIITEAETHSLKQLAEDIRHNKFATEIEAKKRLEELDVIDRSPSSGAIPPTTNHSER